MLRRSNRFAVIQGVLDLMEDLDDECQQQLSDPLLNLAALTLPPSKEELAGCVLLANMKHLFASPHPPFQEFLYDMIKSEAFAPHLIY